MNQLLGIIFSNIKKLFESKFETNGINEIPYIYYYDAIRKPQTLFSLLISSLSKIPLYEISFCYITYLKCKELFTYFILRSTYEMEMAFFSPFFFRFIQNHPLNNFCQLWKIMLSFMIDLL